MEYDTEKFISHFKGNNIFVSLSDVKSGGAPKHYHCEFERCKIYLEADNKENKGIFFTVNNLNRDLDPERKRTRKMFVNARAIWVEDDEKQEKPRTDWPLEPNLIVNSSPGKYHYYWLTFTEDREAWEGVMRRMVADYGCDNQAKDVARVLRLPGFYHLKREPHKVSYWTQREKPYEWKAIEIAFPPAPVGALVPSATAGGSIINSMRQAMEAYKAGHRHGPIRYISMSLANHYPQEDTEAIMEWMNLEGVHERHIPQAISSAYEKRQEEVGVVVTLNAPPKIKSREEFEFPPGLMGQLCQECYEMAYYPNKIVATITAFGLVAGIVGRAFNVNDMGLNIYIAVMMDTGAGKDTINKIIQSTLYSIPYNGAKFVGDGGFTGAKAFRKNLKDGMSKISVITEAGLFGKSTSGDKETLRRDLLDAYTKSGKKSVLPALRYSTKEESLERMPAPAFSIIFESTQKSFIDALKQSEAAISGELARMLILRIRGKIPYPNRHVRKSFSEELKERLKELVEHAAPLQPVICENFENKVRDLKITEEIGYLEQCRFVDRRNKEDPDSLKAMMLSRSWEKGIRLAGIVSVFNRGKVVEEVDPHNYQWVIENFIEPELESVDSMFAESDTSEIMEIIKTVVYPRLYKMLQGELKSSPNVKFREKGFFTWTNFYDSLKGHHVIKSMSAKMDGGKIRHGVDKILDYMLEKGLLDEVSEMDYQMVHLGTGKKPKKMFKITQELKNILT